MAEQAYAYVTLIPVATGFQKSIASELSGVGNIGTSTGKDIGTKLKSGMTAATSGIGSTLVKGLALAGVTVGLAAMTNGLKNAAKAAAEDQKSQALLAQQLRATTGASNLQIASVEEQINKMSMSAAVADDQLRPAFASLVRATGDTTVALDLQQIALDVAAGTGRDLESVSLALGKAHTGQMSALQRLVPSIKGASDPMKALTEQFKGASEAAANNDPFQRLGVIFGELEEQIGKGILPMLNNFADYFSSADFSDAFSDLSVAFYNVGKQLDSLSKQVTGESAMTALINLAGAAAVGVSEIVFALADLGTTAGMIFSGDFAGAGKQMSTYFTRYNKFVQGIYDEQDAAKAKSTTEYAAFDPFVYGGGGGGGGGSQALTKAQKQAELMKDFASKVMNGFTAGLLESEDSLKETSAKAMEFISSAYTDKKLSKKSAQAAHAMVRSYTRALQPMVAEHAAIIKKIEAANEVLAKKIEERFAYVQSIGEKYGSTLSLEESTTAAEAIKALTDRIARTKDLSIAMAKLQELGLSGDLYQQILDSGNLEFAQSVIAGGEATVKELSDLAAQANTTALKLGEDAGNILYNKGIEVAQGVVDGLEARKTELEAQMKFLAEAFGKELTAIIAGVTSSFNGVTKMPVATTGGGLSATSLSTQQASLRASLTALGAVDPKKNAQTYAQARALMTEIRSIESQKTALANTTLVYNAAENKSLNAEADLQQAITFSGLVG